MGAGGDMFVLDMGEPVRIYDLARRMVELSGLLLVTPDNPQGDIEIQVTGLRPGEKLFEELLIGDNPEPTQHPRIMQAHEEFMDWKPLQNQLYSINQAIDAHDVHHIRSLLQALVKGYMPTGDLVDWVHMAQDRADTTLSSRT
jgi:FlaA1/EpsC-like NDP-sugar epimerase